MGRDLPPLPHAFSWGVLPLPLPSVSMFVFEHARGSKYNTSVSLARYPL